MPVSCLSVLVTHRRPGTRILVSASIFSLASTMLSIWRQPITERGGVSARDMFGKAEMEQLLFFCEVRRVFFCRAFGHRVLVQFDQGKLTCPCRVERGNIRSILP